MACLSHVNIAWLTGISQDMTQSKGPSVMCSPPSVASHCRQHKIQAPWNPARGVLNLTLPLPLILYLAPLRKLPPAFLPFSDQPCSATLLCLPQAPSIFCGKSLSFWHHIFFALLLEHSSTLPPPKPAESNE